ncbi:hypothetical protein HX037_00015 [Ignatzschineria indica]|nr:hypothetical protein [Ignatzschineria indica]MDM1544276.1 hypothetical protein [Ignatzschineria indica]
MILKKICGSVGTDYFILLASACLQLGHFQSPLPARSFWKNAMVSRATQ